MRAALADERGAAVAEFSLVAALLAALVLAVLQLALGLHVRNTLADAAAEGARYRALVGVTDADGLHRTRELIASALTEEYARDVTLSRAGAGAETIIEVTVRAPLPAIGLLGPANAMEVTGRATVEPLD
ncbi:TadE/TadG family type IV pilus assembly protein [Agromyces silvae]|uniref:TadE/TadG family type IV pilus assembly protein n=1 Tax=Agromyces silvae TaxID=3388266 RepID=UPI00280BE2A7|nr:TadE/TadG family type IV pilus assembly protein [Agromyces protaetiae]